MLREECLEFFKEKYPTHDLIISSKVVDYDQYEEFVIENPSHTCIKLIFLKDRQEMKIDLVTKCSLSGTQLIDTALDFARSKRFLKITLIDVSDIYYYVSEDKDIIKMSLSLKNISMLSTGKTWYERFGFKNRVDSYRESWLESIHQPLEFTYNYLKTIEPKQTLFLTDKHKKLYKSLSNYLVLEKDSVSQILTKITAFLEEHCPRTHNVCTMDITTDDFIFLSDFIQTTFDLLMWALLLKNKVLDESGNEIHTISQLMEINQLNRNYSLHLLPNDALVTIHNMDPSINGSIGRITGLSAGKYSVQLFNGSVFIPINNIKILDKVILHGLMKEPTMNSIQGKIVDTQRNRYVVEFDNKKKRSVKYENVKGLGGRKRFHTRRAHSIIY
jgi:hypothetical protein